MSNAVRQLQCCVTERNALECFELYQGENRNHATGGLCSTAFKRTAAELAYQRRVESNLQEEMYFKIFIVSFFQSNFDIKIKLKSHFLLQYKIDCRVTIEMLENDTEDASATNFEQGNLSSKYLDRFTNPALNAEGLRRKSRNDSVNGLDVEIKEEKPDSSMVRSFDNFINFNLKLH